MVEKDDRQGRSRRAQRRARASAKAAAEADGEERDAEAREDEAADDEAAEDEEVAPRPPRGARPRVSGQRKRKRKREVTGPEPEEEDSEGERIRDRNRRLRERAAATRRARRKEREVAATQGLDASELMDDALARATHSAWQWIRRHFILIQWVAVLAVAGGMTWLIVGWRIDRTQEQRSDALAAGLKAENGRVTEDGAAPPNTPASDRRLNFKGYEARLTAAAAAYQEAADGPETKATTILARLGLAGTLFDLGRFDEALDEYGAVKLSKLAERDPDVKGRALEGVGLCLEAKQDVEGALRAFRELENTDTAGYVSLARYHQARLLFAKGEKERALELLKQAREQLGKARGDRPPGFLDVAARELQFTIDPDSAMAAATVGAQDPEKLRQQMRELAEKIAQQRSDLSEADLEEMMKDPEKVLKMLAGSGQQPEPSGSAAPPGEPAPAPEP